MSSIPYFDRTLDSFADETITKTQIGKESRSWYASLDVGPTQYISDPDFLTYANTRDEAIRLCAAKIRAAAQGVGEHIQYRCLTGYDLHYRLMQHWSEKEYSRQAA